MARWKTVIFLCVFGLLALGMGVLAGLWEIDGDAAASGMSFGEKIRFIWGFWL